MERKINKTTLTERERQILELLVLGLSNEVIAKELSISVHTVKSYLENLYREFSVHNRLQLAVVSLTYGYLDLSVVKSKYKHYYNYTKS